MNFLEQAKYDVCIYVYVGGGQECWAKTERSFMSFE